MKSSAPLFTDTYDLAAWLLGRLDADASRLAAEICRLALALLDVVTEALRQRDDPAALEEADDLLRRLRLRLRLAGEIQLLDERRMLHALERADLVGRQLGALMRHRGHSAT
jgi:hypothetical protein